MPNTRILIVDDSVVVRHLLREALSGDPQLEVAGVAANGRIALEMLNRVSPDLVTLDIEMPELDGLQTLEQLRRKHPRLPVIMFSTLTERGAAITLDCLAQGASDYVMKPSQVGNLLVAKERIREQLIPKIKALCHVRAEVPQATAHFYDRSFAPPSLLTRIDAIGIGASTGGPNALAEVLSALPADLSVPVLVVQHMPPVFTKFLAQRLDSICPLRVAEAVPGEVVRPGAVWIAAGGYHLKVSGTAISPILCMDQSPPQNSCRPSVDVLFASLASVYGGKVLAVVLTGMGQDGLHGVEELHKLGGRVVVQDEATSIVWGMPGFIARAELADRVLPLPEIGREIVRTVNTSLCLSR